MKKFIAPTQINGIVAAPASKSDMLRAAAAAYLTGKTCEIVHPSFCDDAKAALGIVSALGTQLDLRSDNILFSPGNLKPEPVLDCGESGLCIRMFPSIAALRPETMTLTGRGSLISRPLDMIVQPLRELGVVCQTNNGFAPITVTGPLQAGKAVVDASVTSQFLTGLLMALPLCQGTSEIIVKNLKSTPYIAMTLHLLEQFGILVEHEQYEHFLIHGPQPYHPLSYSVEGDWSGAAFLLVAGAIAGNVSVTNLKLDSLQADRAILDALARCGADLTLEESRVSAHQGTLYGFEFDAVDCPDLFPPLVALACACKGKTVIYGAQRLKVKESDRGIALLTEFRKIGANIALYPDRMEISGSELDGGNVHAYNDHRIAMACAIAALRSRKGVTIEGAECVAKSYPQFYEDLQSTAVYT
ncbi:3-phosphoshikimate 1-carboxyvinyltransferase [Candidatus Vecturithrix granuli]|uniref:3-phosphoshikimate 1-carboxyvinyltransferase n=1 Tax=Vecturithrix granuli TaxID=1499967 RepID=A0A081BVX2_VECG1|nr:3-phosphoshikimate 1-carboxyvinyltransferase [Candidatus Vecturithrix granuli]